MDSAVAVARIAVVTLGEILSVGGTVSTLFQYYVAAFAPRLLRGVGLLMQILDFAKKLFVGGGEDGIEVGQFGVVGEKLFRY